MNYENSLQHIISLGARDMEHAQRAYSLMADSDDIETGDNDTIILPDESVIVDAIKCAIAEPPAA